MYFAPQDLKTWLRAQFAQQQCSKRLWRLIAYNCLFSNQRTAAKSLMAKMLCHMKQLGDTENLTLKFYGSVHITIYHLMIGLTPIPSPGFPTFFLPCNPSAFRQMNMYPFSISPDKHVPLSAFRQMNSNAKIYFDKIFGHGYI